jgi:hypothetical protein
MPDLQILIRDAETGRLRLGLPRPPRFVSGIDLLVQIVALLFMENGGRSIVSPGRAGGLRALLGSNIDPSDPSELMTDMRLIVSRVEQQIKQEQVRTKRPPSERLRNLQLVDIVPDDTSTEVELVVAVVNEEQQQQQAVVVT